MTSKPSHRECLFCLEPIPPHSHPLQKFCTRIVRPDGSVKCCKDDYHNDKRRPDYHRTKDLVKRFSKSYQILDNFFIQGKRKLSLEMLQNAGLELNYFVRMKNADTGNWCLVCLTYVLESTGDNYVILTNKSLL